jgi:hypothetical protein
MSSASLLEEHAVNIAESASPAILITAKTLNLFICYKL